MCELSCLASIMSSSCKHVYLLNEYACNRCTARRATTRSGKSAVGGSEDQLGVGGLASRTWGAQRGGGVSVSRTIHVHERQAPSIISLLSTLPKFEFNYMFISIVALGIGVGIKPLLHIYFILV
jgi:hypothetical protein